MCAHTCMFTHTHNAHTVEVYCRGPYKLLERALHEHAEII